jgi:hypothetical protein
MFAVMLAVGLGCSGAGGRAGAESAERTPPQEHGHASLARVQEELRLAREAFDELTRDSHLALDPELGARLAHVRQELLWLARKAPSWQPGPSVEELAVALAQHRLLLAELRRLPSAEARPMLGAVLRDLEIKSRQCRRFGGPVPVNVTVITRDAEHREVTGYEVWFVRKAYERRPREARRFERHSSPAVRAFTEAGYYVLWAAPPGLSAASMRLDVEVGASEQDQVVDLTAPAAEAAASAAMAPTGTASTAAPGAADTSRDLEAVTSKP